MTTGSRGAAAARPVELVLVPPVEMVIVDVAVHLWPEEFAAVERQAARAGFTVRDLLAGAAMGRARQMAETDAAARQHGGTGV